MAEAEVALVDRGSVLVRGKLKRPSPHVVVAIPTIEARGDAWREAEAAFTRFTCQPVTVIPSYAEGGWSAGLNDVWQQIRDSKPEVLVLGSDDMLPMDDNWLPPLLEALRRGVYPAPTVVDPRWTNYGGHNRPVPDGTPSHMSTFPVILGAWGDTIFPLPDTLSYYADNLIAVKLLQAGIQCVAVPSSRIQHLHLDAGRGFGHGSESAAMKAHRGIYVTSLADLGIERLSLPLLLRGPG